MIPNRLKRGDTIGIVAPSKALTDLHKEYLNNFKEYVKKELELNVVFSKNLFEENKFKTAAGTPEQRAEDINEMFGNPGVDAVWCYQGGSLANQTLDLIDYNIIKKNPKLFLGMSDIDILLFAINKMTGLVTINAPDSKRGRNLDLDFEYSTKWLVKRLLEGNKEIESNSDWKCLRDGRARGRIVGCNLTSIIKIAGTKYFPDFKNTILFLEAYKENVGNAQWKLELLKNLGVFDKIKGIVIGYVYGFQDSEMREELGNDFNFEDLVLEATKDYCFPILKINEFGHRCQNAFIPIGAEVEMDATNKKLKIINEFVK